MLEWALSVNLVWQEDMGADKVRNQLFFGVAGMEAARLTLVACLAFRKGMADDVSELHDLLGPLVSENDARCDAVAPATHCGDGPVLVWTCKPCYGLPWLVLAVMVLLRFSRGCYQVNALHASLRPPPPETVAFDVETWVLDRVILGIIEQLHNHLPCLMGRECLFGI